MSGNGISIGTRRGQAALCLLVALAVGVVASAGVFLRGDGGSAEFTSVRGERYEYATGGVYAFNSTRVVAEGVGWDWVTLLFAVPAMLAAAFAVGRGTLRGRLLATGLFAYYFYQYLEYATFWAFGTLFLPFVAIYAASLAGIAWIVSGINLSALAARVRTEGPGRYPRIGMAALCFGMSALLLAMWLKKILGASGGAVQGVLFGSTTLVVQAYDLGLVVPFMILTACALLARKPVGYLLGTVFAVKAVAMASAIAAMLLSAWALEGRLDIVPFGIFSGAALVSLVLLLLMLRSIREGGDE